jgi:hypothetical protein
LNNGTWWIVTVSLWEVLQLSRFLVEHVETVTVLFEVSETDRSLCESESINSFDTAGARKADLEHGPHETAM